VNNEVLKKFRKAVFSFEERMLLLYTLEILIQRKLFQNPIITNQAAKKQPGCT
jgi:hypothetical protein